MIEVALASNKAFIQSTYKQWSTPVVSDALVGLPSHPLSFFLHQDTPGPIKMENSVYQSTSVQLSVPLSMLQVYTYFRTLTNKVMLPL